MMNGRPKPLERLVHVAPFSFWEWTRGSGTPIVLLHGLSGSWVWWRKNIDALAERHAVSAIDLIGFGKNRRFISSPLPLRFAELTTVLGRWLERDFVRPVHLVGHSMGGQIAIHLAASRPDRVRSLVLIGSTGIPFGFDPATHLREFARPPKAVLGFSPILARDLLRAGPSSVLVAWARLMRDDVRSRLHEIHQPTLLVWGETDSLVPLRYAYEMKRCVERSELVVVPKAGHLPMWDRPEVFNREVLAFFERVEGDIPVEEPVARRTDFGWGIAGCETGICYRQSGPRPTVVLIHGLGIGSRYFGPLARELHRRRVLVLAPDLPGFGASPARLIADPKAIATRLAGWADALGIQRAVWATRPVARWYAMFRR